jgi:hypothetical protein
MNVTPLRHHRDMCNCPSDEELYRYIDDAIDGGRWAISGVGVGPPDELKWLYTIGLEERFAHPELVVVGVCCGPCGGGILNRVGDRIAAGDRFDVASEEPIDLDGGFVHVRPVRSECWASSWFAVWHSYYDAKPYAPPPARAVQVVFQDRHGRFPWEPGADAAVAAAQQMPDAPPRPRPNRAERRRPRHRR